MDEEVDAKEVERVRLPGGGCKERTVASIGGAYRGRVKMVHLN